MFDVLKEQLDIVEVAETLLNVPFKQIGEVNWAPEDETCPFCGHKDCFRLKKDGADSLFKCFSCDAAGDLISLVAKVKNIGNYEAGKELAKEFKIALPRDFSPLQEVMNMAAAYYHNLLWEAGPCAELGGLTPLEYQKERRGHTEESMKAFQVGWSDGGLIQYLEDMGVEEEIIATCGLRNKAGRDFLPQKAFIYPHKVRGRVSHFTFKDPLKKLEYQLPNKYKLNGHSFYNSDSISREGPVIVVEGENDAISVFEAGWPAGIICCNGSISQSQLEWIETNLADRDVISIYDVDAAGDKYRDKTGKLRSKFRSLVQVKLTNGVKDIDEYLKAGGDLKACIDQAIRNDGGDSGGLEIEPDENASGVIEKNGAYYKVRYKDGNEFHIKLTNFTIQLLNIFIRGPEREREILIIREDGKKSKPLMIPSEAKVSLKPFKTLVANSVDASFYGKEEDMIAIWEHVYKNSREAEVHLPDCVGRVADFKGWLFADCFISETGAVYEPDENGVIWVINKDKGLRAISMETERVNADMRTIPKLLVEMKEEDREELIGFVLQNLAQNLGNTGMALTIMAWAWGCVYSDEIHEKFDFYPFLYLWGRGGRGKTTIVKWLLSFFNLEVQGWATANQLNSGVSFSRKLSYYASIPMAVDEMKMDKNIIDMEGIFRSWYNRGGRTVSSKDSFGIRTQPVRSTVLFSGEDQFTMDSSRQRCIHIRVPRHGRELAETYRQIDSRSRDLKAIGYHWIQGKYKMSKIEILDGIVAHDVKLRETGLSSRSSEIWSVVAYFGTLLAKKYFPDFDYFSYVAQAAEEDTEKQQEDDLLTEFWTYVEGLQSEERARITNDHFRVEEGKLYVWFAEVYRLVTKDDPSLKAKFYKRTMLEALREESYFIDEDRKALGVHENVRRVVTLDLTKVPDVLERISQVSYKA